MCLPFPPLSFNHLVSFLLSTSVLFFLALSLCVLLQSQTCGSLFIYLFIITIYNLINLILILIDNLNFNCISQICYHIHASGWPVFTYIVNLASYFLIHYQDRSVTTYCMHNYVHEKPIHKKWCSFLHLIFLLLFKHIINFRYCH